MALKLEELQTYQLAMEMADKIWDIVIKWDYFAKDTVGIKLNNYINSIDKQKSQPAQV